MHCTNANGEIMFHSILEKNITMNKSLISISIAIVLLSACSGNQTKKQEHNKDVHIHEDGSVHQNHEEDTAIKQEEFTVPVDTSLQKGVPEKEHTHDGKDEHEHPHNH